MRFKKLKYQKNRPMKRTKQDQRVPFIEKEKMYQQR